ncbi:MAG TPA: thioredoxin domain-containing protein [Burkholderiales bacterium]|nr:thioredoxin domain-containing protein [Burkholderiales bacterium]
MDRQKRLELAVPVSTVDHALGRADAPLTIVEYGDFDCPNCKQAVLVAKLPLDRYSRRARLVFRHFPQEEIRPHALPAAPAAEAAGAQGKFWPMHHLLFGNQQQLKLKQLGGCAERLELDMTRFRIEVDEEIASQRIREQIDSGNRSGVRAASIFFINRWIQGISFGLQVLEAGVEEAFQK